MSIQYDVDGKFDPDRSESNLESGPPFTADDGVPSPEQATVKIQDPNLISWDSPSDPENPKNWTNGKKWRYTITVSLFTFISPISSAMVAPALEQLGRDLGITSELEVELALSIFLLAYAIGPIFFGPTSEMYGRVRVLQFTNFWYLAWNLGCGFAQNPAQFFVFRFLAGLGGSAPLAVGGGALSDVWLPQNKGRAMAIYTLCPIFGPVIGPVAGAWIAERSTWRWVFWSTSAFAVVIQLVGLFGLTESHGPTILKRKRNHLIKATGNNALYVEADPQLSLPRRYATAFARPVRMLFTQPIVALVATYIGYTFGINFLLLIIYPQVYTGIYGESVGIAGLHYLALGIGLLLGLLAQILFVDKVYLALKTRNKGQARPEFRIPTMFIGSLFTTIGLFWYGWTVEARVFWLVPDLAMVVFGAGFLFCLNSMQTYIIDAYQTYAASAIAAATILRSLCGFAFPLFAPYMYQTLGYGWGTSLLGFISIAIGWSAPAIFWFYGQKLRAMSEFASG